MELSGISKGKVRKPYLLLVHGPDGVGKSTFGSEAPSPIFIGPENGSNNLDVARFNGVDSWDAVRNRTKQLLEARHDFKTVVYDSLDWIEPLLWHHITKGQTTIEDAMGGYGRGFTKANEIWKDFMLDISRLREKMNVIVIAHSMVKTFNDPSQPLPYDRYMLKLNDKASAIWREFVDCVLFANYQTTVFKANKSDRKAKAEDGGHRLLYTTRSAAYDAKNRLGLPPALPLSYAEFDRAALSGQPDSVENIMLELGEIAASLPDDVRLKMAQAVDNAKGDATLLAKIRNHARVLEGKSA